MELEADLIVLGVRGASGYLNAATHLERTTAHKVVAHAPCPVLTVRAEKARIRSSERRESRFAPRRREARPRWLHASGNASFIHEGAPPVGVDTSNQNLLQRGALL